MTQKHFFTSESVTEGHPDKMCDQISDAVLDATLQKDPDSRVAVECLTKTGFVVVAGELTTEAYIDIQSIARDTIKQIGYTDPQIGFDYQGCGVLVSISEQEREIAQGVDEGKGEFEEQGAGDQGLMFGYATNETEEYMPLPITLAHGLTKRLAHVRKENILPFLRPDGKSQVTIEYEGREAKRIEAIVLAAQHSPDIGETELRNSLRSKVIQEVCGPLMDEDTKVFINSTGRFVHGGPVADAGVTGRKIIVDSYGGVGSHGGGCFSGKDPTKVDRSGTYMARYIAKNVVAAELADECEIQIAYSIGVPEPVSVLVDTFGTSRIPEEKISEAIRDNFPLKPGGIINYLDLKRPIYKKTATYGHFGREDEDFTWENLDKVSDLKKYH